MLKLDKELKADHIYPFSKGGLTTWDNLQLLCISCNSKKSNKLKYKKSYLFLF
ncbi:HNH endonuclease [Okeania sp. SIO2B3]|uniref:HNH endonuclease n=1 Tax=Okeania sp. SIO2B3 TaxID=2607784 RepID=UPI00343B8CFB